MTQQPCNQIQQLLIPSVPIPNRQLYGSQQDCIESLTTSCPTLVSLVVSFLTHAATQAAKSHTADGSHVKEDGKKGREDASEQYTRFTWDKETETQKGTMYNDRNNYISHTVTVIFSVTV